MGQELAMYVENIKKVYGYCMGLNDLGPKMELVSLEWLLEMANPDPTEWTALDANHPTERVSVADLAKDLKKRGLREPLLIGVGLTTGRARLEAGNHRIRCLLDMGFLHAPACCWVGASHVGFVGNGTHEGRSVRFWPEAKTLVSLGPYDERFFERPSLILPSAPVWDAQEPKRDRAPRASRAKAEEPAVAPAARAPRKARAKKEGADGGPEGAEASGG